ncbi:MAG TPA: hypothetical protein VLB44_07105 [Kofleriaceae bacterium]|nr:hypothetical protein [Kofleriaceae bacterium]
MSELTIDEVPDDVIATLSDFLDGVLPEADRPAVEHKIADDPVWKFAHEELAGTRSAVKTLKRQAAPQTFDQDVTSTIHKRSAGRFFARKTFGDRVPFGAVLVVALILLAGIGYVLHSSQTGSLRKDRAHTEKKHERLLDPP